MNASGMELAVPSRSARHQRNVSSPYSLAWMILRPIRSIVPRPELRSGWAERTKMTTISASGGAHGSRRLAKVGAVIGHDTSVLNHEFHAASRRLDAPDA